MTDDRASRDFGSDEARVGALYDWWSRHRRVLEAMYEAVLFGRNASLRDRSLETLDVTPGEYVLEVGCGHGNSFQALREAMGPSGRLVGLDVSRGMTRAARRRVRDRSWRTVEVVRGDAPRPPITPGRSSSGPGVSSTRSSSRSPSSRRTGYPRSISSPFSETSSRTLRYRRSTQGRSSSRVP